MKKSNILILAVTAIFMFPNPTHSQNGPDPVRAGMFKLYAKTATKALVAQDAVLTLNGGEHIMSKEEVDKINNFQNQFNKYLTSFDDILTIAAEIYAIYFEVDHAVKNIKELKSFTFSCPANTLAVALSKSRSHIYSDIIDNGIQIAADVEKLLPISKDEDKNSKMTEKERIDCISRVRKSLQSMNYKIRKLNRLLRYTTLMDSWYELRGKYYKPKSMYTISTECQKRWARKARGVMN
ncbi:hypothetical protein V7T85_06680 [Segatella copri]|jgi:hypothetical protein|uniref:hypothetical protein n=1 Tax=Segatella copri TaxID=165179 RepID=UPI002FEF1904